MEITVVNRHTILKYESQINSFLSCIFDSKVKVDISKELACGVLIMNDTEILSCGFAHTREMSQGKYQFKAGIVGGIAVSKEYRGNGYCKNILKHLENELKNIGVDHSFLFAYEPQRYHSSGYIELNAPIHYFDKAQKQWLDFVYRGGMVKTFGAKQLNEKQVIEFQGCVY